MKKLLAFFMAVIMLFALAACDNVPKTDAMQNTLSDLLSGSRRVWDRHHPDDDKSVSHFAVRTPDLSNALIEYREDCKVYVDGEYLLGGTGNGCESLYLSDLTGDGCPELCFGMNTGSGAIDACIEIIDYTTKTKVFSLSDRLVHDYYLFLRDGDLCVKETEWEKQDATRTGVLKFDGSEISVAWDSIVNDKRDP